MIEAYTDGVTPAANLRNWMDDQGARLVDSGFPVLPIYPGTKCPGQYSTKTGWRGYRDWSKHCGRGTTQFELDVWRRWPGCGVGVPCGLTVVGVDIDVLDPEAALAVEALARKMLGDSPALRVGRNPKRTLVYRPAARFAPIKLHPIEILADGTQFVAYAIHPDTGEPYRWPMDELSELSPSDLPVVTEAEARAFAQAALALVPPELRVSRLPSPRDAELYYAPGGNQRGTAPAVSAALEYLPNDDLPYDDWIKIGLAIKAAVGDADGWLIWQAWSAQARKNDPAATAKAWRSFKPHSIGAGSIYSMACTNGWSPESHLVLPGTLADALAVEPNPAAGLIEKMRARAAEAAAKPHSAAHREDEPFDPETGEVLGEPAPEARQGEPLVPPPAPRDVMERLALEAPGLLGEMVAWITDTAESPQPFLALGASLCALGTLAGRRFLIETPETHSSVYVLALADSGAGKDHPRVCIRQAFIEAGLGSYLGGETLASGSALLNSVASHPSLLFQIDEFGHFVQAVLDPKSHAAHRREIMTNLTTLWSSAGEVVIGTSYANQKERPKQDIHGACVCVYGSAVPSTFWKAMQSGNVSDGSLARFLIFHCAQDFPDETDDPEPKGRRLPYFAAALKRIATPDEGNLGAVVAPNVKPKMVVVPLDEEARALSKALKTRQLAMKRERANTQMSSIVARFRQHVLRVALIAAVAERPSAPVVTAPIFDWATRLVDHCLSTIMAQAEQFVSDSEYEATCKRALADLRKLRRWVTLSELNKVMRWLDPRKRREVLTDLVERGEVEQRAEGEGKHKKLLYRAAS